MPIKDSSPVPVMLYDGDCGFCKRWIERWEKITGNCVRYRPYQEALGDFPQLSSQQCIEAVHLVMPDGMIYKGAHAVFKALHCSGKNNWLLWFYNHVLFFDRISESVYRFVARHRQFLSKNCSI